MTGREIIRSWLKEHGYDGLCHSECEYGCPTSCLCICDSLEIMVDECKPAYAYVIPEDDAPKRSPGEIAFSRQEVSKHLNCANCAHQGTEACGGEESLCSNYAEE